MIVNRLLPSIPGRALGVFAIVLLTASASDARERKPIDPAARMAPLRPAVIDETLAIGGEELEARKLRSRLTVEVGVNDTGPYRFVVDSGADTSVIGERLAKALQLPAAGSALLNGVTESRRVDRVLVSSLRLGSSEFNDLQLPRLNESDLGATGMIGLDALVEQRLMLDFDKRRIAVEDAKKPAPQMDGEIVVTARLKRGQLILTQVRANGLSLDAVIDTGSEVTIGNTALRNRIFKRKNLQVQRVEVIGVTGAPATVELVVVDELRVGAVILNNVPVAFADVPPFEVFGLQDRPALLLGTDMLENFRRVSLDFRSRKVRFQLRNCGERGIVISTTGTASRISAERGHASVCGN